jgi:hypothetical protein
MASALSGLYKSPLRISWGVPSPATAIIPAYYFNSFKGISLI